MDLKDCLRKICSISKKDNSTVLFDCKDKEVYSKKGEKLFYFHAGISQEFEIEDSKKIKYFYTVNHEFRKAHKTDKTYKLPTVWILIGQNDGEEKLLQVGRNKSSEHMLRGDISIDARHIIEGGDNKYSKLDYSILSFYQVDIDLYLDEDKDIFKILNRDVPQNEALVAAYYNIKAAYVEGKLAALSEQRPVLWNPSGGIDGDFHRYFQKTENQ